MSLIIDGYNLMHAANIVGRGRGPGYLERSRLALLNALVEAIDPRELSRTIVVFDAAGAPPGLPPTLHHRGLTVRFAKGYTSADELIAELIKADSAPKRLTVVSSDHQVQRAAQRRKAKAVDSDAWYAQTATHRKQRRKPKESEKPAAPKASVTLSESDVEYWLRQFRGEPDEPPPDDDIFPPGYAEELEE
jgi:predicted RNA-binding protein with PIN domain